MDTIEHLDLTDKDFDMLVEGLEALSKKDMASELVGDLMVGMFSRGDKSLEQRLAMEKKRQAAVKDAERRTLNEDIKILQGKLILLKRYLLQKGAMAQANEVLGKKS
jgi:hypothetical protein